MYKKFTYTIPIVAFLCIYGIYALLTYPFFGITWDESDVYSSGKMTWIHLGTEEAPDIPILMSKVPGNEFRAVYDSAYAAVLFKLNPSESFEVFHLLNMLFQSIGFIAVYAMLAKRYKNPILALAGPIALVFLPRYFGDFASNPKDVPFASMHIGVLALIYYVTDMKNVQLKVLLLGVGIGLLQSFRILGMTAVGVYGVYEAYLFFQKNIDILNRRKVLTWVVDMAVRVASIVLIALCITMMGWPYLGSSFFKHFQDILETSREYPWLGGTLTNGQLMYSYKLPWHYLPTWFAVTTPIMVLVLCIAAVLRSVRNNFRYPLQFLLIITLLSNISLYYISDPHIYDGMRHFMFLLPVMGVLAASMFIEIMRSSTAFLRYGVVALVILNMGMVAVDYAKLFPYHYVYFNEIVGGLNGAAGKYETDYWGATYREAALWLRAHTQARGEEDVKVHTCANPILSTYYFGPHMEWERDPEVADYSICYTRTNQHMEMPGNDIHVVRRDGVGLNYIKQRLE